MDRNQLWRLIQQKEKEFERAKMKRFIITVLVYAAIICALCFWREFKGFNIFSIDGIRTLAETYLPSVLIAIPFVLFSVIIFNQLQTCETRENAILEDLRKQLKEVEKNDIY